MSARSRAQPWFAAGIDVVQRFVWQRAGFDMCLHGMLKRKLEPRAPHCSGCFFDTLRAQGRKFITLHELAQVQR